MIAESWILHDHARTVASMGEELAAVTARLGGEAVHATHVAELLSATAIAITEVAIAAEATDESTPQERQRLTDYAASLEPTEAVSAVPALRAVPIAGERP